MTDNRTPFRYGWAAAVCLATFWSAAAVANCRPDLCLVALAAHAMTEDPAGEHLRLAAVPNGPRAAGIAVRVPFAALPTDCHAAFRSRRAARWALRLNDARKN